MHIKSEFWSEKLCFVRDRQLGYQGFTHFLTEQYLLPQVSENIELVRNSEASVTSARSDHSQTDVLDEVENYISTHDVVAKLPFEYLQGASLRISPRNLDNDELTVSIKLPAQREGKAVAGEGTIQISALLLEEEETVWHILVCCNFLLKPRSLE